MSYDIEAEAAGVAAQAAELATIIPLTGRRARMAASLVGSCHMRVRDHLEGRGGKPTRDCSFWLSGIRLYLQSPAPREWGVELFERALRFHETLGEYGPRSSKSESAEHVFELISQMVIEEFRENHPDKWELREGRS